MRDIDIRRTLLVDIFEHHSPDDGTIVVEELGLCQGTARVDVAAVNGTIHGYEIKSERDTLARLDGQVAIYNRVLTYATVVAAENHIKGVFAAVPSWWGVYVALADAGEVRVSTLREATRNPEVDPSALVQLLWRDETLAALESRGLSSGIRSKPRHVLWERLAASLPTEELILLVRDQLKLRPAGRRDSAPPA
jgi:hypothetical protein